MDFCVLRRPIHKPRQNLGKQGQRIWSIQSQDTDYTEAGVKAESDIISGPALRMQGQQHPEAKSGFQISIQGGRGRCNRQNTKTPWNGSKITQERETFRQFFLYRLSRAWSKTAALTTTHKKCNVVTHCLTMFWVLATCQALLGTRDLAGSQIERTPCSQWSSVLFIYLYYTHFCVRYIHTQDKFLRVSSD